MKYIILCIAAICLIHSGFAQTRTCGTTEYQESLHQKIPGLRDRKLKINKEIDAQIRLAEQRMQRGDPPQQIPILTLPIVVHVLYKDASTNISDEIINGQIEALNRDFNNQNAEVGAIPGEFAGLVADFQISFCLASVDPNGNPTSGIQRRQTDVETFISTTDDAKFTASGGIENWDPSRYLNVWIVPILRTQGGTSLLGYATFPGDPANVDGVVIDVNAFGDNTIVPNPLVGNQYDRGRTLVHEIGHWLNLRHIWGDASCGDDMVDDTPSSTGQNTGCPAYPANSNCGGTPHAMLTMNYMDYVDDDCMYMFTNGQKTRALTSLLLTRTALVGAGANCADSYTINAQNGINNATYRANNFVRSSDIILLGENNGYKAGNRVELVPGFRIAEGGNLRVTIGACCDN